MIKLLYLLVIAPVTVFAQVARTEVREINNTFFKHDPYWRGADGAATVALGTDKILWLFSDTFIDQDGTGKRSNARKMIRNSIALQGSDSITSEMHYYYGGTRKEPEDFFKLPGNNWFWTGHGTSIDDKLVIFLIEETSTNTGIGFEAVGWHIAVVRNPGDNPEKWIIRYFKGPETFGVIVGSSAVLQDENFVYAFGVKEPSTHETYLLRIEKEALVKGDFTDLAWRIKNEWITDVRKEPVSSSLFTGQTEFSVHFDRELQKYIQIQTYGFGKASIGYRIADELYGPWSEPVIFHTPALQGDEDFVYTANAHPEFISDGLIVSYNINNLNSGVLIKNEDIYFPKIIELTRLIDR